jgi:hypothetical protein
MGITETASKAVISLSAFALEDGAESASVPGRALLLLRRAAQMIREAVAGRIRLMVKLLGGSPFATRCSA